MPFTPGPWIADLRAGCAAVYPADRKDDTQGCHLHDDRNVAYWMGKGEESRPGAYRYLTEEQEANANLIAAAPDMYAALEQVVANLKAAGNAAPLFFGALTVAEAAIAKARGEQ